MKQVLQLKLGQQLTMTPQLQQAIKLLQLSSLDLQAEIQENIESNPLLEMEDELSTEDRLSAEDNRSDDPTQSSRENSNTSQDDLADSGDHSSETDTDTLLNRDNVEKELATDTQWEHYTSSQGATSSSKSYDDREDSVYQGQTTESLQDYLTWQLELTPFSDLDRVIAEAMIDGIDDKGYLSTSLEDIISILQRDFEDFNAEEVEQEEFEAVLHRIQQFDPPGVAARDLQECLMIQLNQMSSDEPAFHLAQAIVKDYFSMLGTRQHPQIIKSLKVSEQEFSEAVTIIRSLNPYPGESIQTSEPEYVIPDALVYKSEGRWQARLNPESSPKLKIHSGYASLIKRADNSSDNQFLKNSLQEARWFIKSLLSRNETLLKVTQTIVEKQQAFFEHGEEAMKPMVLQDIADAVEMHESTISRVTTQKYMHTPRGVFELKYFFSSHVSTAGGGECSSTAIRALLKKIITAENPKKPLSDNKIAQLLKEQGINVARRTIAKYREAMSIPPSNERKSLI